MAVFFRFRKYIFDTQDTYYKEMREDLIWFAHLALFINVLPMAFHSSYIHGNEDTWFRV